jgi:nitroimidazol reductase NimA-like FMN-containing flavoprotein (pyridoxamine 5'-phosphate oxidase superfamily)
VRELPPAVRDVLERGTFCHVAAATPAGPHLTPLVFAVAGGRVWVTTSRTSVKARAWRADAHVAGLVRDGARAVAFAGTAATHDVLEPSTWGRSLVRGPVVPLAAARFTRKNARFFAGYAVDARNVPLAWTPPGRVFVELSLDRVALLEDGVEPRTWGWPPAAPTPSAERFRAARTGADPLGSLPPEIRAALGDGGRGALALEGDGGPVVLPAAWTVSGAGLYAVLPEHAAALAAVDSASPRAALGLDRPSSWRARHMLGAMARGRADLHATRGLVSGARSARELAGATAGDEPVVARIRPERFVWWRGWTSGTVGP